MTSVMAYYQHRVDGPELVNHEKELRTYRDLVALFDDFPWAREMEMFEKYEEGGGFYFVLGDENGVHATYQYVPMELNKGWLEINVLLKEGFLFFGRQKATKDFDIVSNTEAQQKIKELFEYSVESLYKKYKKK